MKVITGFAKGRSLVTPEGLDTRPTADRIKQSVFNSIQFDIEGRRVLDLFAGSGQLGIEALSRGAKCCTFVDSDSNAVNAVKSNLSVCQMEKTSKVYHTDFDTFIKNNTDTFDLVFLDPPYREGLLEKALEAVVPFVSSYGIIVCEHLKEYYPPNIVSHLETDKRYDHGRTTSVTIYRITQSKED